MEMAPGKRRFKKELNASTEKTKKKVKKSGIK